MEERRRYKRSLIADSGVKLIEVNTGYEPELISVVDFSSGGLSLSADKAFPVDTDINIALATSEEKKIALTGKVIWTQLKADAWMIGISLMSTFRH
jgi:hypothetical protein